MFMAINADGMAALQLMDLYTIRLLRTAMQYTRIYADSKGESHFDEVTVELSSMDFAPPAPPLNVSAPIPAAQMVFISSPPGWFGDWHPAPRKQFWVQIAGQIEVEVSDGEVRRFKPGAVALLEDITGKGHVSRVVSQNEKVMQGVFVQMPV